MKGTVEERFWAKVDRSGECWLWTASRINGKRGPTYGQFGTWNPRKTWVSHRFAYELLVGPVPDGQELHHTCEVKICVNPSHLEMVTRKVHVSLQPLSGAPVLRRQKTHCPKGHSYSGDNLIISKQGFRHCRECMRLAQRRLYEKKRLDPAFVQLNRQRVRDYDAKRHNSHRFR